MKCTPGDLAVVLKSVDNNSIGVIVQCIKLLGLHSKYGPIWHCRSKTLLVTEYGAVGHEADFPDDWLRPIRPNELDKATKQIQKLDTVE